MQTPYILGIDLGGSSIKTVAVTFEGSLLSSENIPFVDRDQEWAGKIREWVVRYRQEWGCPAKIGLSAPGLASLDGQHIAQMPGRLIGLERLNWTIFLEASSPIPVLNDAHAALMGEVWQGAARGMSNVVMLTLGTGVGGAAMVDGRLLKGHIGRAGHLGHTVLNFDGPLDDVQTPGSLEMEIGNKTIFRRSHGRFATTHLLVQAHLHGDSEASELWGRSVRALAAGIATMINILDPEAVIIGGGIARANDALFEPLQLELDRVEWRPGGHQVKILPAQLGDFAGAYGSAWTALKN